MDTGGRLSWLSSFAKSAHPFLAHSSLRLTLGLTHNEDADLGPGIGVTTDRSACPRLDTVGDVDLTEAWARIINGIESIDPWRLPDNEPSLLLSATAATQPATIPAEVATALAMVIKRADLRQVWQPGLDEAFQLLSLLIPTLSVVGWFSIER